MTQLTHNAKVKLAKAHLRPLEMMRPRDISTKPARKYRLSIWDSLWWQNRKLKIKAAVAKREAVAKAKAAERKAKRAA